MSLVGFFTKRDMSTLGGQLRGALIGLIVATLVNGLFLRSGPADFVLSIITVFDFCWFYCIRYPQIKTNFTSNLTGNISLGAVAISGALSLYLDFY